MPTKAELSTWAHKLDLLKQTREVVLRRVKFYNSKIVTGTANASDRLLLEDAQQDLSATETEMETIHAKLSAGLNALSEAEQSTPAMRKIMRRAQEWSSIMILAGAAYGTAKAAYWAQQKASHTAPYQQTADWLWRKKQDAKAWWKGTEPEYDPLAITYGYNQVDN